MAPLNLEDFLEKNAENLINKELEHNLKIEKMRLENAIKAEKLKQLQAKNCTKCKKAGTNASDLVAYVCIIFTCLLTLIPVLVLFGVD